jgi:hypothetical protein
LAIYLDDWSNNTYVKLGRDIGLPRTSQKTIEENPQYKDDRAKLMDELAKQDKKEHVVGNCPTTPVTPAAPIPQPNPPPAGCTTQSQAEIDADIAKATDELLDTMKLLRRAEDAVVKAQASVDSWNPRMGENNPEILERKERLVS